jgi:hypothetical protein
MPATSRWLNAWTATPARTSYGYDWGLKVREGENQVRVEREDLRNVGRDKGGNSWFFAPNFRRPHGVAGDADNAMLFTKKIKGLSRLFGKANDPQGWKPAHRLVDAQLSGRTA